MSWPSLSQALFRLFSGSPTRSPSPPTVRVGSESSMSHCPENGISLYSDASVRTSKVLADREAGLVVVSAP
ncbi:hypothetical protein ARTHRO9AX_220085 [Arthrobacter sp. 9AX]|nr:hypothetical protein ARTHRO9AX_220085 [Arthrobacter sp. 9AX]